MSLSRVLVCEINTTLTKEQQHQQRQQISTTTTVSFSTQVLALPPEAVIPSPRGRCVSSPPPSPGRMARRSRPNSPARTGPRIWGCHTPLSRKGSLSISRGMRYCTSVQITAVVPLSDGASKRTASEIKDTKYRRTFACHFATTNSLRRARAAVVRQILLCAGPVSHLPSANFTLTL